MLHLYEILGVPADASTLVIRQAFRHLALQLHPDKVGGGADCQKLATEAFYVVKTVADTLLDVRQRELYDMRLKIAQVRQSGMISDTYYLWEDFEEVEVEKVSPSWRNKGNLSSSDSALPSFPSLLNCSEMYTTSTRREYNSSNHEGDAVNNNRQKRGVMRIFQMECRCGGVYEVVTMEEQEEEKVNSSSGTSTFVSGATTNEDAANRKIVRGEEERRSDCSESVCDTREGDGVQVGQRKTPTTFDVNAIASASLPTANNATLSPSEHIVECDSCSLVIRVLAKASNST